MTNFSKKPKKEVLESLWRNLRKSLISCTLSNLTFFVKIHYHLILCSMIFKREHSMLALLGFTIKVRAFWDQYTFERFLPYSCFLSCNFIHRFSVQENKYRESNKKIEDFFWKFTALRKYWLYCLLYLLCFGLVIIL